MKKKLLISFTALSVAVIMMLGINLSAHKTGLSALSLANVEALTNNEGYVFYDGQWVGRCCPPFTSSCWTTSVGVSLSGKLYAVVMYCN